MAWIELTDVDDAQGLLKSLYDEATARAGGVANIVKTMSPNPPVLQASMMLYVRAMKGPSGLSRREREMLATVTSRANDCFYWTESHAEDFRRVGGDEQTTRALRRDWREAAGLTERERALCAWAAKLTRTPGEMAPSDLAPLRAVGLTDSDIHDAAQVVAYFNYINRIADALGTDLEAWMPERPG